MGFSDHYLEALNELVKQYPEVYLTRRANLYLTRGQPENAKLDYDEAIRVSHRFGLKHIQYSPLAWALKQRAEFYAQQGDIKASLHDRKRSEKIAFLQDMLFGFSEWPIDDFVPSGPDKKE